VKCLGKAKRPRVHKRALDASARPQLEGHRSPAARYVQHSRALHRPTTPRASHADIVVPKQPRLASALPSEKSYLVEDVVPIRVQQPVNKHPSPLRLGDAIVGMRIPLRLLSHRARTLKKQAQRRTRDETGGVDISTLTPLEHNIPPPDRAVWNAAPECTCVRVRFSLVAPYCPPTTP
jgi:hypothetical protein